MLKLVGDPFQFDLLARKAADLLGIGEQVLRKEARGPDARASRFSRGSRVTENRPATTTVSGDAGAKAEIGLVALALLRPELRAEIAALDATENFEDLRLAGVLADLCKTDEEYGALDQWLSERLSPEDQSRISEIAVGPLVDPLDKDTQKDPQNDPNDLERARKLASDYAAALEQRRQDRTIAKLRRETAEMGTVDSGESIEAMKEVVAANLARDRLNRNKLHGT
jgi:hypothetical protein